MESTITSSVESGNVYKAGYKVPWSWRLMPVLWLCYLLFFLHLRSEGLGQLRKVLGGGLGSIPAQDIMSYIHTIEQTTLLIIFMAVIISFSAIRFWNMSRYGSLIISPAGLVNHVGYYRTDNIKWSDVVFVSEIGTIFTVYRIRIKLAHGSIIVSSDTLFDADETIRLIRQYAGLDVEKSDFLETRYWRST